MFSESVVLEQKNFQVKPHNMIKLIPNNAYARIKKLEKYSCLLIRSVLFLLKKGVFLFARFFLNFATYEI